MTYQEVLEYLYLRLPMYQRIGPAAFKKDLTNTIKLCEFFNNPQKNFPSIHIAGTNGKGSSSHMLAAVLQMAGYKTGLYTSPHLKDFTERIRINGIPISESGVTRFVMAAKTAVDEIAPSFFELTVAMAFDYFSVNKVDVAVIETGLGGRFDSTNIIVPRVSLITNISLDHQDLLGNTLPEIAFEKAGIIKPGIPVVVGHRHIDTEPVFNKKASSLNSPLIFSEDQFVVISRKTVGTQIEYRMENHLNGTEFNISSDLPGDYQVRNIPPVLSVLEVLKQRGFSIPDRSINEGLANTRSITGLQGRWQVLSTQPYIVCDVAHNEDGIQWVVEQLRNMHAHRLHFVFGMVRDKNPDAILKLLPLDASYYFCQAGIPRARDARELADTAAKFGLTGSVYKNVNEAISAAENNYATGDIIFVGGSTFIVAEINMHT